MLEVVHEWLGQYGEVSRIEFAQPIQGCKGFMFIGPWPRAAYTFWPHEEFCEVRTNVNLDVTSQLVLRLYYSDPTFFENMAKYVHHLI